MMRDDIATQLILPQTCAVDGKLIAKEESAFLWPLDSDEQWMICETHLPELQARYERIKFKGLTAKMLEEFRKK